MVAFYRFEFGSNLLARDLIPATIDRIEKAFGEVSAGAKELHLLADTHRRDATGDCTVIAPGTVHDFIILKLQGACVDCDLCRKAPKRFGQSWGVPDRKIRLRRRAKIVKRLQEAEAG